MDVLVIGGSVFLGRAVVREALGAGAEVTVFNRGISAPQPADVAHLRGDRTVPADLAQLAGRGFDVVVDTSGYVPADVAASATLLADNCGHYAFVSSISAYPQWPGSVDYAAAGVFDAGPDATRDDRPEDVEEWQAYGWLKAGCEQAVRRAFGTDRAAILRAGGIVGPDDSVVGRLPWWLDRASRGGEILVPGAPDHPIALIDSRDLARFALSGAAGTFECGGPVGRDTWADLMSACAAATGANASFTYVDGQWLNDQGLEDWTELPLWVADSEGPGVWAHDNAAGEAAGLRWRPLADTVADTWAWQRAVRGGWTPGERTPGLAADRERELLAAWHARQ
jgi:2'-hydroxyisoflavone reductase